MKAFFTLLSYVIEKFVNVLIKKYNASSGFIWAFHFSCTIPVESGT